MVPTHLLRWALGRVLRYPWFWLWAGGLAALGPAVRVLRPLGTTTRGNDGAGLLLELAFLAILAGVVAGMSVLLEAPFLLAPLGRFRRLGVEAAVCTVTTLPFLLSGLLPLALLDAPRGAFSLPGLAQSALVAHLHVLAIGSILLRVPLPVTVRLLLLPGLAWVMPAFLGDAAGPAAWLGWLCDASRPLSQASEALDSWIAPPLPFLRPIAALLLAATLLDPPALPHALRHPR